MLSVHFAGKTKYYFDEFVVQKSEEMTFGARHPDFTGFLPEEGPACFYVSQPAYASAFGVANKASIDLSIFQRLRMGQTARGVRLRQLQKGRASVDAFDFTFSAPKSLSLLWCLGVTGPDSALASAAWEIHLRAVRQTLDVYSNTLAFFRKGKGGSRNTMTGVIAGGIFNHCDARPSKLAGFGDPHLHSHCVIFNTVYDGENFRALDARPIMKKDVILTFGQAYQKAVSEGLHSHKFDQILVRGPEGMIFPAIPAIPKPVISAFSSRSDDISQYSMTMSVSRQTATLNTRRPKISNIVEQLSIWKEMFGLFSFDLRQYRHYVQQTKKTRKAPTPDFLSGDLLNRLRGRKVRLTEVLRETILEQMRNVQMSLPELMARLIASRYFMRVTNRIATLQLTDHAIAYLDSMIALRNAVHRLKTENRRDAPKINRNSLLNIKSILNESNSALPAPPTSTSDRQQENPSVYRPTDTHNSTSGAGALQSQKGKDERLTEAAPRLIQRI